MKELIRLDGLKVHFPIRGSLVDTLNRRPRGYVRAVDGIDLAINEGEVLGLVGESGSGKTTVGRVIVKLTRQTAGKITFDGEDVTDLWGVKALRAYRRRVQLIFQDPYETLNPKQTIHDFVAEPLEVNNLAPRLADREARVISALESAGLPADFAFRYPHELSGGQRQRVVIAGALAMGPQLVVADEPVSMLDVSIRTELLRLMLDLRSERGLTYLFITHDLSLAWVIADRIAVMYLGKIMEVGPADQVIRSAHHPYTAALVSVSPTPAPPAEGGPRRTILVGETPDAARIPSGCRFHPRCPLAFDRCKTEEPPLFDVGSGQSAACWLAEGGKALPVLPSRTPAELVGVSGVAVASAAAGVVGTGACGRRCGHGRGTRSGRDAAGMTDAADAPALEALPPATIADLLAASSTTVVAELEALGVHGGWRPAAGEWSANECVGHLIEAERRGFAGRIRTILGADRPDIPPDLEAWDPPAVAEARQDHRKSAAALAAEFAELRSDGIALVRGLTTADLARAGRHPHVGELRVDELLGEWVHHDRNHVRQMLAVTQARVWGQMGNARRFSLEDL